MYECAGGRSGVKRRDRERETPVIPSSEVKLTLSSHWSKGMAFAQWLILLRVERLPLQVDLAEL